MWRRNTGKNREQGKLLVKSIISALNQFGKAIAVRANNEYIHFPDL